MDVAQYRVMKDANSAPERTRKAAAEIGSRIAAARIRGGLSKDDIAAVLPACTARDVDLLESGAKIVDAFELRRIADALSVSVRSLLRDV